MRPLSPDERKLIEFIRHNKDVVITANDGIEEVRIRFRGEGPRLVAMAAQEAISKSTIKQITQ